MIGKVKHKAVKGYAFVRHQTDGTVEDVFLHVSEYTGDWEQLKVGDVVDFTRGVRRGGNPIAMEVSPLGSEGGNSGNQ